MYVHIYTHVYILYIYIYIVALSTSPTLLSPNAVAKALAKRCQVVRKSTERSGFSFCRD